MTNISQSQNTVYIIRKGDMIIKPVIDDYEQTKGSEIWKYDSTIVSSPFKTQKIVLAHERSDMYYIILHLHLISNLQCLFQFSTL